MFNVTNLSRYCCDDENLRYVGVSMSFHIGNPWSSGIKQLFESSAAWINRLDRDVSLRSASEKLSIRTSKDR